MQKLSPELMQNPRQRRALFLDCPVDLVGWSDLRRLYTEALTGAFRLKIEGVNVSKIVDARADKALRNALASADLLHIDGMGVHWGLSLFGLKGGERVAGIDLFLDLCAFCEKAGHAVFLLGAAPDVVEKTARALSASYPRLKIAGAEHGYFADDDWENVAGRVRDSGADVLFVGISSPKKERFIEAMWDQLGVPISLGVGGSFDVVSGDKRRAPRIVQQLGLEWVYRLAQEPSRLLGRYVVSNTIYLKLILLHLLGRNRSATPPTRIQHMTAPEGRETVLPAGDKER